MNNPISAFFVENIVTVFFIYGLAFFVLGLAVALTSRRASEFKFAQALRPLAVFGLLHGIHEWVQMFQIIAVQTGGQYPPLWSQAVRLVLLVVSFAALLMFGLKSLNPQAMPVWRKYGPLAALLVVWMFALSMAGLVFRFPAEGWLALADVLARYVLGIPGALIGTWALMAQQRVFRQMDMPEFGRDLVWSAAALVLYGVVGQLFVRASDVLSLTLFNSHRFFLWFGVPIELVRTVLAVIFTVFVVRALRAFETEAQRRLERANLERLAAQEKALAAERDTSRQMERLNDELRLNMHKLALLLDLSNVLAEPLHLQERLQQVLSKIVNRIHYSRAGMILLNHPGPKARTVVVSPGFANEAARTGQQFAWAQELGEQCIARQLAMCRHLDGNLIEFLLEDALLTQECRHYRSPTLMIGLPLTAQERVIGSLVLVGPDGGDQISADELTLIVGIGQQLGLSIENARLNRDVKNRERMLAELLHQIVEAQESERKRIARELHDATSQSLTAISLGLRGVEKLVERDVPVPAAQIRELQTYSSNALGELRRLIADLRPSQLDDLGLVAALQWYVQSFEQRWAIDTRFEVDGQPGRLPTEYETVLFRIIQEALTNIAKHAQATQATVSLHTSAGAIQVMVEDNGVGFDPTAVLRAGEGDTEAAAGWGLLGIQERTSLLGGVCKIQSEPGNGCRISVRIPLMMELKDVENSTVAG